MEGNDVLESTSVLLEYVSILDHDALNLWRRGSWLVFFPPVPSGQLSMVIRQIQLVKVEFYNS